MEIIPVNGSWKKQWSRRGNNHNYSFNPSSSSTTTAIRSSRNIKTARLGGGGHTKHSVKITQSSEVCMNLPAPQKLWRRLKNGVFGSKKAIAEARNGSPMTGSKSEFENRLFFEMYKSTAASLELGYTPSVASR